MNKMLELAYHIIIKTEIRMLRIDVLIKDNLILGCLFFICCYWLYLNIIFIFYMQVFLNNVKLFDFILLFMYILIIKAKNFETK